MAREKFPIVNDRDEIISFTNDKKMLHCLNMSHRAIHIFVETYGGRFILQKKGKGTENEGKWSSAVSGHVRIGEFYRGAAVREMEEELGLEIYSEELDYIGKLKASPETGYEFIELYIYLADNSELGQIKPSSEEIEELVICPLEDIKKDVVKDRGIYSVPFLMLFDMFLKSEYYRLSKGVQKKCGKT